MLIVHLQINNVKTIKVIGIHNVHVDAKDGFMGNCPYNVYVADKDGKFDIGNPITQIHHNRTEGAEVLAAKALLEVKEIEDKKNA